MLNENCNNFQYNPLLTYTIRFQKLSFKPNVTGNYTINKYKENEFVNGYLSINSSEILDKVDN